MQVQVKKWGNSASVRLPSGVLEDAGLRLDDYVDIREENGRIVIEPIRQPNIELDALLSAICPENLHNEELSDRAVGPVGNEWI